MIQMATGPENQGLAGREITTRGNGLKQAGHGVASAWILALAGLPRARRQRAFAIPNS
ncbi:hypothetical protein CBM2634_A170215 [Cupriavidus taiwanensis]|uniref:Uncharacterized protein n=1 Tax=Cupriavidus taiwanensis TaxID=164546 RepID=A0A375IWY1_9BURK|nr:hypothetical protein CBM2634_A170215 [Cupriavidus taiwanensis]